MFPVDTERNINLSKHSIMNKTKQGYVAPLSDLLVVRFEENIMSPNGTWGNSIKEGSKWESGDEDYGLE